MNDDDRREPLRMLVVEASLRVDSISARLAQLHRACAHASSVEL